MAQRKELISIVAKSCNTDKKEAECILENQLDICRRLALSGELDYDSMVEVCMEMGLEPDYIDDMLLMFC